MRKSLALLMLCIPALGQSPFTSINTRSVPITKDTTLTGISMASTATYATSLSATTSSAVPVGDFVVCTTEAGDSAPSVSFSDNVNGTYPVLGYAVTGSGGYHEYLMVYGVRNTSAAKLTITQKFNIPVNATGTACDFYKNVNGAKPIDAATTLAYLDQGTPITSLNIGASYKPSGNNEIALCPMSTGTPNANVSPGSGFALGTIRTDNAVYPEYQVQTAAAAVNCPFTLKSSNSDSIGLLFLMPSTLSTGVMPFQGTMVAFSGLKNGSAPTAELLAGGVSGGVGGYFGPELDWYAGSTWGVSDSHSTITGTTTGPTNLLNQTLFLPAYFVGNYKGNSPLNLLDTVSSSVGDFVQMNLNSTLTQMSWGQYIQWDNSNSEPAGHVYDIDMVAGKSSDFMRLQLVTTGSGMKMNLNSAGETPSTAFTGSSNTAYWVAGEYNQGGTNSLWVYSGCPSACTLVGHTTTPDGRSDPMAKFLWGLNDTTSPVSGSHIWFRNTKICWPSTDPNACMP